MLISCRKEGESLAIGEQIEIRIISVRKNKVTLGVVAPRDLKIATRRLSEMEMVNTMAVAQAAHLGEFFSTPKNQVESVVFVLEKARILGKTSGLTDERNGSPDE